MIANLKKTRTCSTTRQGPTQSKKESKYQESIKSSTTPEAGYQWESDNVTIRHHKQSQEVSPFPAGDHKASTDRRV